MNPEPILKVEPRIGAISSLLSIPEQIRITASVRPQSGKIRSNQLPFSKKEYSAQNLDMLRKQRERLTSSYLRSKDLSPQLHAQTNLRMQNERLSKGGDQSNNSNSLDLHSSMREHSSMGNQKVQRLNLQPLSSAPDDQTQATEHSNFPITQIAESNQIIDLNVAQENQESRQSALYSYGGASLIPIAEETHPTRNTLMKPNMQSILS